MDKITWKEDGSLCLRGELSEHIHFTILKVGEAILLQIPGCIAKEQKLHSLTCISIEAAKLIAEDLCKDFKGEGQFNNRSDHFHPKRGGYKGSNGRYYHHDHELY